MRKFEKLLQANIELKEKLELYKDSVEKMNGALFIYNYNTMRFVWASENVERMTGYTPKELFKLNNNKIKKLFQPDDIYFYKESNDFFINPKTKDNSYSSIFRIKHKDGCFFWCTLPLL